MGEKGWGVQRAMWISHLLMGREWAVGGGGRGLGKVSE